MHYGYNGIGPKCRDGRWGWLSLKLAGELAPEVGLEPTAKQRTPEPSAWLGQGLASTLIVQLVLSFSGNSPFCEQKLYLVASFSRLGTRVPLDPRLPTAG